MESRAFGRDSGRNKFHVPQNRSTHSFCLWLLKNISSMVTAHTRCKALGGDGCGHLEERKWSDNDD